MTQERLKELLDQLKTKQNEISTKTEITDCFSGSLFKMNYF